MRTHIILVMVLTISTTLAFGQTQSDMNTDAGVRVKEAEKELNDVYKKILQEYRGDTAFIRRLKGSQRIWIKFREAEIGMKYPGNPGDYGSAFPMCVALYKEQLTKERIKTLKVWLDGVEEGDVCNGSVKAK